MTDALSMLSMAVAAILGVALFGLAALQAGADSRESYEDDHRRSHGGQG